MLYSTLLRVRSVNIHVHLYIHRHTHFKNSVWPCCFPVQIHKGGQFDGSPVRSVRQRKKGESGTKAMRQRRIKRPHRVACPLLLWGGVDIQIYKYKYILLLIQLVNHLLNSLHNGLMFQGMNTSFVLLQSFHPRNNL